MDREQFKMLVKGMKAIYVQPTFIPDADAFNMWFALMGDLPYDVCNVAIQKYMLTHKFPPTVAEIREMATEVVNGEELTWGEGWEKAMNVVRRFGSYNQKEAMESLDPVTRKCVESIGYMQLCMSENIMVERAHFQKIFDIMARREKESKQMPPQLKEAIATLQLRGMDTLRIEGGKNEE